MLNVRHKDRLRWVEIVAVDDLEGQAALQKAPVKALQRRETALGARYEGDSAVAALFVLAADEQQRSEE